MKGKRTNIDFSEHTHRVELLVSETGEIRIDHFQVGTNNMGYFQFVSTPRFLAVSGDYGNWIFCRPFYPSKNGSVSDGYWIEKLKMYSIQEFVPLDFESIREELEAMIENDLEESGYEGEKLSDAKKWFSELLELANDEDNLEYLAKAYRDSYKPDFIDYDEIPCYKETPRKLQCVFDAFDEICRRMN